MRRRTMALMGTLALATVALFVAAPGLAGTKGGFKARLSGFQEVPAISTGASGELRARVSPDESRIEFELTWTGLEGGDATAAHIHLGQRGVNGAPIVFLCGGPKPPCPSGASGTVSGTIVAADVQAALAQGIAAGELDELLEAMRRGVTYVNVHNARYPGGEIRGQVRR
jgi:hypothetical protein